MNVVTVELDMNGIWREKKSEEEVLSFVSAAENEEVRK